MQRSSGNRGDVERRLRRLLIDCFRDCRGTGRELDAGQEIVFRRCVEAVRRRLRARGVPVAPAGPRWPRLVDPG